MDLLTLMLGAVTDGFVLVEREGISVRYPCKPILIATMNSEDAELKDVFLDRIGIALNTDTEALELDDRVAAVNKVLLFSETKMTSLSIDEMREKEDQLRNAIIFAREYLKNTKISKEQLLYLCEESNRGGCEGHRAEITAARIAIASAALEDAPVRADDLRLAVKLAIVPRSLYQPREDNDDEMLPPPPPPPAPAQQPQNNMDEQKEDENKDEDKEDEDKEDDKEDEEEDDEEEEGQPSIPEEFMFEAVPVAMADDMMKFGGRQKAGKGGKSGILYSRDRGRYVRPVMPMSGEPTRVAIDATLREAAKNQLYRRQEAKDRGEYDANRIYVEGSDVRSKLMARKAGSLIIFAVDASGSMALNRMNAAKGAACGLLTEAYQSRDKIALIPFQGATAEVLLPPTRSISMAKSRLDMMPCGGGSPLAHALTQAVRTGLNAMESGDVGRCVIVLISDGRANVPLNVSTGAVPPSDPTNDKKLTDAEKKEQRTALKEEVLGVARQIASMGSKFKMLVIDTENKFVSTGMAKEIAQAAGGKYHYIPKASADAMKRVTVDAVASLKNQK
jgi:magnesium chelatase subunit D